MELAPKYSGKASVEFWAAVNRLPEPHRSAAYSLGCAIQSLEFQALATLIGGQEVPKKSKSKSK